MKITYAAKSNRKELVKALVTLTSQPPTYSGPPTYNYYVGDYTVDRDGNLVLPDNLDETVVDELTASLENMGFTYIAIQKDEVVESLAETADNPAVQAEETADEPVDEDASEETAEESVDTETEAESQPEETFDDKNDDSEDKDDESEPEEAASVESEEESDESEEEAEVITEEADNEPTQVTLSFPVSFFAKDAIERMRAIVASKASLLKKALDTETLDIVVDGDKVYFPWFTDHGIEGECDAYSKLAFAIAKMAITQTRVVAKEKQNPDEKLAMRLFLIRLGFIGDEYKSARSILMRNFDSAVSRKQAAAAVELCMPEVSISSAKHDTPQAMEANSPEVETDE